MSKIHAQIQWYPGHMARARREIGEAVKLVDVVIEIIDARIPMASRNPILNEIIGDKPRIIVLNKSDLADSNINKDWINKLNTENQKAILVDSNNGIGTKDVVKAACEIMKDKLDRQADKGRIGGSVKAMVVGIPNVGKSTFINKIAGKQTTVTGNKPGVTKKNQWVRLDDRIQLLDTPGVLWPKLDNELYARHLAYIGTIKDEVVDIEELAVYLLDELVANYKEMLYNRFKISEDFSYEMTYELLEEIGRKRGCLVRGGEVDYTKVANILFEEFRSGKIGRISLEKYN
ncbi:MAG: ribosome biogenesis GTPase YlqF [Clostridia bacterium]|nr:ribosome biogenesis GTPase YlqF [Clostridia bacterium]